MNAYAEWDDVNLRDRKDGRLAFDIVAFDPENHWQG